MQRRNVLHKSFSSSLAKWAARNAEQEQKRLDRERLQEEARRKAEQLKAQSTQAERGKTNKKKNSADAK